MQNQFKISLLCIYKYSPGPQNYKGKHIFQIECCETKTKRITYISLTAQPISNYRKNKSKIKTIA